MTARLAILLAVPFVAAVLARAQVVGPQVEPAALADTSGGAAAVETESRNLGIPRPAHEGKPLLSDADTPITNSSGWMRVVAALAGTIVVAVGAAAAVRRLSGGALGITRAAKAPSGLVEVLARYPLSPRESLIVLKLDRRVLLLSQSTGGRASASGVRTLCEITDPEEVASILLKTRDDEGDSIAARFRDAMDRQSSEYDSFEDRTLTPSSGLGRLTELA